MIITTDTAQSVAKMIENRVGMPYQEFEKLNFETQQRLINEGRKKQSPNQSEGIMHEKKGEVIYSEPGACVKKIK